MYVLIFECEMSIIDFVSADDYLIILSVSEFVLINEYDFYWISRIKFFLHIQYYIYELDILKLHQTQNNITEQ